MRSGLQQKRILLRVQQKVEQKPIKKKKIKRSLVYIKVYLNYLAKKLSILARWEVAVCSKF